MFQFTETIGIQAPASAVWRVMRDINRWWPRSNPEHLSLELLDDPETLQIGTRLRIQEKIAGIPGEATGTITDLVPGQTVTWEARARYRWLAVSLTVREGVTWRIAARDEHTTDVSAGVWAVFPGIRGRLLQPVFVHLLRGVEKDREHTRTELRYLKSLIEAES